MLTQLKAYSTVWLFIFYCFFLTAINYLTQSVLLTNQVYHNSYAEQLSYDRIEQILNLQAKWGWLSYSFLPLIYSIKFSLVACCLLVGSMFFDIKIKFSEAFKIALLAEIIFIAPMLIKVFWFLIIQKNYVLKDIQIFSPFSMLNIFEVKTIGLLWIYPLQTLNIFELLYILLLGFWTYKFAAKSYEKALNMVLASYLPALCIWLILIMFATLNLNPQA